MNIFAKLQSYFTATGPFEPMTQFRYVVYVNDKPLFIARYKTAALKKTTAEFDVPEYLAPDGYKFMIDILTHKTKKIHAIIKIDRIGPLGDTVEENILINPKVKGFEIEKNISDIIGRFGYGGQHGDIPTIRLKLKFDRKVTTVNY